METVLLKFGRPHAPESDRIWVNTIMDHDFCPLKDGIVLIRQVDVRLWPLRLHSFATGELARHSNIVFIIDSVSNPAVANTVSNRFLRSSRSSIT